MTRYFSPLCESATETEPEDLYLSALPERVGACSIIPKEIYPKLSGLTFDSLFWDDIQELHGFFLGKVRAFFSGDLVKESLTSMEACLRCYQQAQGREIDRANLEAFQDDFSNMRNALEELSLTTVSINAQVEKLQNILDRTEPIQRCLREDSAGIFHWPLPASMIVQLIKLNQIIEHLSAVEALRDKLDYPEKRHVAEEYNQAASRRMSRLIDAIQKGDTHRAISEASAFNARQLQEIFVIQGQPLSKALDAQPAIKKDLHLLFSPLFG